MSGLTLRPYQRECIDAVAACDARTQLVTLATGGGKTIVFSSIIQERGGSALILAHRDELLGQARDKLTMVAPELAMSIGLVQASSNDVGAPVVIGSVQTLASSRRLAQLPTRFRTVIVDEAHRAAAPTYGRILEHVKDSDLVLGFTATPERHDRKSDLRNVFEEMPYARSLEWMIREGYLCDLRAVRVTLNLDLSRVKKSGGDFQAEALGEAMEEARAVDHSVAAYLEHAPGKRCVAFFPTVAMSQEAAEAFQAAGVKAAHIDGETPKPQRRELLRQLATGALELICNVGVLTEGYDEPTLECIIIAAPTKSRIKYAQMVGRGTRLYPGKTECLVLDLAGVSDELTVQSVGLLFGLRKPPKPGETATKAVDREAREEAEEEQRRAPGARRRPQVKSRPAHLFNRDAIQWCKVGDRFVVDLVKRDRYVVLEPIGDSWRVVVMTGRRAVVAARNLDLGYAQGAAEQLIRDAGVISRVDRDEPWRGLPATEGQYVRLRRLGVHPPPAVSKGEAQDLITTAIAAERLERYERALAERHAVPA